jgi:hypothetical protein
MKPVGEKTILYPKTPLGFLTDCMNNCMQIGSRRHVINCYEKLKFLRILLARGSLAELEWLSARHLRFTFCLIPKLDAFAAHLGKLN